MRERTAVKKYGIAFLFCLLIHWADAQKQFVTYSVAGNVSASVGNEETKLQPGNLLPADAAVNLGDDGAVTFICEKGMFFSITIPGNYSLNRYYDTCHKEGKGTILNNYAQYIRMQVTRPGGEMGRDRREYLPNYRVVVRHPGDIWIYPMFDTINYSGNGDFLVHWKSYTDTKKFRFTIYKQDNLISPLYDTTVAGTKMLFTEMTNSIRQGSSGYWGVSMPGEESDDLRVFNNVSKESYDNVQGTIQNLKPVFEGTAEKAFRTAFMLENAHYFAEAQEYYATATILAPTNLLYWNTMREFRKNYEIE